MFPFRHMQKKNVFEEDKTAKTINLAISPLATMFSTLFNNKTIFYGDFSGFCHHVFKVVCWKFVECGKGLKDSKNQKVKG